MFALKGSFGFDLIIPMDSLTFIPFSCCEKNLRRMLGLNAVLYISFTY